MSLTELISDSGDNVTTIPFNEQIFNLITFAIVELIAMFLIDRCITPNEVPMKKRSQFVRDILCIPISFGLWLLAADSCMNLYSTGELRWFGRTANSYLFLFLYVSHNSVQVCLELKLNCIISYCIILYCIYIT